MLIDEMREVETSLRRTRKICKFLKYVFKIALVFFVALWVVLLLVIALSIFSVGPFNQLNISLSVTLPLVFYIFATIMLLSIMHGVFRDIADKRSPFSKTQVRRFRWAAVVLLAGAVVEAVFSSGVVPIAQIDDVNVNYRDSSAARGHTISINAGSLLGAALLFTISFVFEYGALLQEFTDDTL